MASSRWAFLASFLAVLLVLASIAPVLAQHDERAGLDPADMDLTVDPRQDFYRFANGGWLERTTLPSDEGAFGVFNELDDLTREQLLTLLNEVAGSDTLQEGSDEWKAAELFRQGMDIETRNEQGVAPIQPLLDEIDAIATLDDLHAFQRTAAFSWLTGLFWTYVYPDFDDSTVNAAYLSSSFLGLPNRDYYLEDDEGNAEVRAAYIATNADLLEYAGYDRAQAEAAAQAVYDFERALAEPTLTREEQQDLSLSNNPMSLAELSELYPLMDWDAYMADLGLTEIDELIVTERRYLEALDEIVQTTPLEVIKDFIKLEVMWSFADFLSEEIGDAAFAFQGGVLGGVEEQRPLEERTLDQTSGMLGEAIGRLYVDAYFPPEAKEEITALVDALIVAFRARLEANEWMSAETKAKALAKLDNLTVKVGYPDRWLSYEAVEVADSYVGSFLSAVNAETRRNLDKAGKPVDRTEWFVPPQVVNAFYDPPNNAIVFPAAILQPPFFDFQADPAANFGAIGSVIGHEITHGFDLQGAQFDAEGNLGNWWTEEDYARFDELNQRVVAQYGAVEVLPGLNVDGQITVTENVADLGGVQVAYDALGVYLAAQGEAEAMASPAASPVAELATPESSPMASPMASPVAISFESLTPQERFFIAAATTWRQQIRDEALETQVRVDVHAPAELRATLPIRNMDEFHEVFGTEPGDAMYLPPQERIVIW
jgi:putative endopeptidase